MPDDKIIASNVARLRLDRQLTQEKLARKGEPEGLSRHDFIEDRLVRLVRQALEQEHISLGRAAEILGLHRDEMRKYAREWVG